MKKYKTTIEGKKITVTVTKPTIEEFLKKNGPIKINIIDAPNKLN